MEQIELREELEDIGVQGEAALPLLDTYKQEVGRVMACLIDDFGTQFGRQQCDGADATDAIKSGRAEQTVYKMQFVNKLLIASDHLEEKLLDY